MMKRLQKYSIFIFVILCSLGLVLFKNQFQKDYEKLDVAQIEKKIKNKDSFVVTFTNIPASNKESYQDSMMFLFSEPNKDVIKMNKLNRDYVSENRTVVYYNDEIYSKEEKIKKIFDDLFKKVQIKEINFDDIPVTVWIKDGKVLYAGIGQTSKDEYLLLTNYTLGKSKKAPDVSQLKFKITQEKSQDNETKNNEDEMKDKDKTSEENNQEAKNEIKK